MSVEVRHRDGSYLVDFATIDASIQDAAIIVTDENVHRYWGRHFGERTTIVLPPGEQTKSIRYLETIYHEFATGEVRRGTTVYAVGGGVVGDLAGFAAATYMRGIPYVQVPTTLLAMVDSSVGGKVGIDLPEGKNLAGAFWQPRSVRIPVETLRTLPERHFRNGMAEVWKYGFIGNLPLLSILEAERLTPESERLTQVIETCVRQKADVVHQDEFDTTGARAVLNFGHTVGHALEKVTGYESVLHGEAIAIGMVAEARIGEALGITEQGCAERIAALLGRDGLPVNHPELKAESLIKAMRLDKKATESGLAFSLIPKLGECKLFEGIDAAEVASILSGI